MPPRAARTRPAAATAPRGSDQLARLENRLVLVRWLLAQFGYSKNEDLLKDCVQADEGYDEEGVSHVARRLLARPIDPGLRPNVLRYDGNVRRHLEAINRLRAHEPVQLRYFQHLALLVTELVLDRLAAVPNALIAALNRYVAVENKSIADPALRFPGFALQDFRKLAFMMATGSGKTLLLHLNLLQYRHYFPERLDNVLLITPNEGLSAQHIEEARLSGVVAQAFDPERADMFAAQDALQVIEITKLVEDKRGGGVSVPVSRFAGRNLIFVDEGHKGAGGDAWRKYRDDLGRTGFTFEYSATFAQALNAAGKDALTDEYGQCIVFDYSYKYFYEDGFGKDFRLLNLDSEEEEARDMLLTANVLSFYEQLRTFEENAASYAPYGIEKPLWMFVGSTVTGGGSGGSDVLAVVRFFDRFLANTRGATERIIARLLTGDTGFESAEGVSPLEDALLGLRECVKGQETTRLFRDVLRRVFHVHAEAAKLELQPLRGAQGEIALAAAGAKQPFGVINIGEPSEFLKLADEEGGLEVIEDVVGESLFDGIKRPGSPVNVLLGAKKFMEGWSTWRVSSLGLLNVGRDEGSQIIQLFGRGVRLLGHKRSLKRSSYITGVEHPSGIELLERLSVFSVRASYMEQFRESLLREGLETDGWWEIELPLFRTSEPLKEKLAYFRIPEQSRFAQDRIVVLRGEVHLRAKLDWSSRVTSLTSRQGRVAEAAGQSGSPRSLPGELLNVVDWQQVYLRLLEHKRLRGWHNMVFSASALRLIAENNVEVLAPAAFFEPHTPDAAGRVQEAVCEALESYFDKLYRLEQHRYETERLEVCQVKQAEAVYEPYRLRLPRDEPELLKEVQALVAAISKGKEPDWSAVTRLKHLRFDRHLFQPLLVATGNDKVKISPLPLQKSEKEFVEALKKYWEAEKDGKLSGVKLFLLRNLSRGKGIGFYHTQGFFPDFLLWLIRDSRQRVLFVEPHGLRFEAQSSDKISGFHERIKEYTRAGLGKARRNDVEVDGWIVSATPLPDLKKQWNVDWDEAQFAERHIVFPGEGAKHLDRILGAS